MNGTFFLPFSLEFWTFLLGLLSFWSRLPSRPKASHETEDYFHCLEESVPGIQVFSSRIKFYLNFIRIPLS